MVIEKVIDTPFDDEDITRGLIIEENDAASSYDSAAEQTTDPNAKEVYKDIAREEKVHAGELQNVLSHQDPESVPATHEGWHEAEGINTSPRINKPEWGGEDRPLRDIMKARQKLGFEHQYKSSEFPGTNESMGRGIPDHSDLGATYGSSTDPADWEKVKDPEDVEAIKREYEKKYAKPASKLKASNDDSEHDKVEPIQRSVPTYKEVEQGRIEKADLKKENDADTYENRKKFEVNPAPKNLTHNVGSIIDPDISRKLQRPMTATDVPPEEQDYLKKYVGHKYAFVTLRTLGGVLPTQLTYIPQKDKKGNIVYEDYEYRIPSKIDPVTGKASEFKIVREQRPVIKRVFVQRLSGEAKDEAFEEQAYRFEKEGLYDRKKIESYIGDYLEARKGALVDYVSAGLDKLIERDIANRNGHFNKNGTYTYLSTKPDGKQVSLTLNSEQVQKWFNKMGDELKRKFYDRYHISDAAARKWAEAVKSGEITADDPKAWRDLTVQYRDYETDEDRKAREMIENQEAFEAEEKRRTNLPIQTFFNENPESRINYEEYLEQRKKELTTAYDKVKARKAYLGQERAKRVRRKDAEVEEEKKQDERAYAAYKPLQSITDKMKDSNEDYNVIRDIVKRNSGKFQLSPKDTATLEEMGRKYMTADKAPEVNKKGWDNSRLYGSSIKDILSGKNIPFNTKSVDEYGLYGNKKDFPDEEQARKAWLGGEGPTRAMRAYASLMMKEIAKGLSNEEIDKIESEGTASPEELKVLREVRKYNDALGTVGERYGEAKSKRDKRRLATSEYKDTSEKTAQELEDRKKFKERARNMMTRHGDIAEGVGSSSPGISTAAAKPSKFPFEEKVVEGDATGDAAGRGRKKEDIGGIYADEVKDKNQLKRIVSHINEGQKPPAETPVKVPTEKKKPTPEDPGRQVGGLTSKEIIDRGVVGTRAVNTGVTPTAATGAMENKAKRDAYYASKGNDEVNANPADFRNEDLRGERINTDPKQFTPKTNPIPQEGDEMTEEVNEEFEKTIKSDSTEDEDSFRAIMKAKEKEKEGKRGYQEHPTSKPLQNGYRQVQMGADKEAIASPMKPEDGKVSTEGIKVEKVTGKGTSMTKSEQSFKEVYTETRDRYAKGAPKPDAQPGDELLSSKELFAKYKN